MGRYDEDSIVYAANWYIDNFKGSILSSSTENFDSDFQVDIEGEKKNIEVKTFKTITPFKEWERKTNIGYCFKYAPSKELDINCLALLEDKPTQEELQEYYYKEDNMPLSHNKRLYALNAASGRNFKIYREKKYQSKWYKLFNDHHSELIIIFPDGIVHFDHQNLVDAFAGYGYKYSKKYQIGDSESYWQMKAFIDLDKGKFYPLEIPENVIK